MLAELIERYMGIHNQENQGMSVCRINIPEFSIFKYLIIVLRAALALILAVAEGTASLKCLTH